MKFKQWYCGMFKGHAWNVKICICEKCGLFLKGEYAKLGISEKEKEK